LGIQFVIRPIHYFTNVVFICSITFAFVAQRECRSQDATSPTEPKTPENIYYGELDAGTRLFRFAIRSDIGVGDKPPAATLLSLDEGNGIFPVTAFTLDSGKLSFQLKSTGASYEGVASDNANEFRGTWKQRGSSLPLNWRRVDAIPRDTPDEVWQGSLNTGLQKLELQLRGYSHADGKPRFYLDSLSQKVGGFKVDVVQQETSLQFSVAALRAKFDGKLNDARDEAKGKWSQGIPLELTLKKSASGAALSGIEFKRPQTPVPPFPYEVMDVTFAGGTDSVQLAGTLTYPSTQKRHPLAILISGSGPQDRDETLLEHKPFWILADYLTRRGVAVLRYDDRGIAKSQGDFNTATSRDFADDVLAAIRFAKTLDVVDPKRIGLIGHSEGGMIAPMAASQDPTIAWIVLMAGTGVNGREILLSQGELIVATSGGGDTEKRLQRVLQIRCFDVLNRVAPKDDIDEQIDATTDLVLSDLGESASEPSSDRRKTMTALVRASLRTMHNPWFRFFITHEPGPVLEKVRCPVLAINGEKDVQVDPKLNLPAIEKHLRQGGNPSVTVKTLASLNHLFQTCSSGALTEYQTIEETISPIALQEIADWIGMQIQSEPAKQEATKP
jgi:pimeloyl-ACP methyl ester carboxylesterase